MPNEREDLQVTPLEEWEDKPEGFVVLLPESGKYVRVKRTLDMLTQLRAGMIPNPLAKIVKEMMLSGVKNPEELALDKFDEGAMDQMLELQDKIVARAITEPKVSMPDPRGAKETDEQYQKRIEEWVPPKGTLSLLRIPLMDRQFVASVAQGAAVDVIPFRPQPPAHVANVPTGEAVPSAPKQPPRAARRAAAKSADKGKGGRAS